jgi:integrase
VERATVRQKKTGQPVRFELTEQTRQAVDHYISAFGRRPGEFLFPSRRSPKQSLATRQYARLVDKWVTSIGLDATRFGTHSLRRTKASLIYRRTGNLRAVQLLLGHTKIESTVRYLESKWTTPLRLPRRWMSEVPGQSGPALPVLLRPSRAKNGH